MNTIHIKEIAAVKNRLDISFDVSKDIEKFFLPEHHFFAEYTFNIDDVPESVLVIPVLTNLLQLSWLTDSVIWLNEIDEDFYNQIYFLKSAFSELHPDVKLGGTLIAAKYVKNNFDPENEALQLFTGGIDATATLLRHYEEKPILFNTNGWYKSTDEKNVVYDADYNAITEIAENNELNAVFVKSNFATFIRAAAVDAVFNNKTGSSWWFGFQHSPAFLGCAMVAAYHFRVKKVYIASSYTFGQYVVCVSDPRIDKYISCSGIKTIHDGYELSRQDKVKLIVQHYKKYQNNLSLRVCSFNTHNCCSCEKCFRSMLALAAEGADDLGKFGFELDNTLLNKLKVFISKDAMELDKNHIVFWYDIISIMGKNYDSLYYKEVYDYLKNLDLNKARKNAILNHYKKDFIVIVKRKLSKLFKKG